MRKIVRSFVSTYFEIEADDPDIYQTIIPFLFLTSYPWQEK